MVSTRSVRPLLAALCAVCAGAAASPRAQHRLPSMPGYAQHQKVAPHIADALESGAVTPEWSGDSSGFEYTLGDGRFRFDVATGRAAAVRRPDTPVDPRAGSAAAPERGRQYTSATSPDGKWTARFNDADRNLYLVDAATSAEVPITSDGSRDKRIKYGTASWVYGEELDQITAMWWSPDSRKLAFYRFDESQVPDYHLQLAQTKLQSTIDTEAYPKAGAPNPMVDLMLYDVASRTLVKVDVRDGQPFADEVVGHYAYNVRWTPGGGELLFNRTNRRQNVLEVAAAEPASGEVRVVLREEWPTGWVENSPAMVFLADGRRFIWQSERNGWNNFYLYDLSGTLITPLTAHTTFETVSLVKVDEAAGVMFYTARDGDNPLKLQLHRVGLDGKDDRRLTDPRYHHTIVSCMPRDTAADAGRPPCAISPDSRHVVDVYQTHAMPPATRVIDAASGAVVADVAKSDMSRFHALGLKTSEIFSFKAADGKTVLHGLVQFPSTFNPARKYPVLVQVYGGPGSASHTARETFVLPSALTEYGFLVVNVDSRNAPGRGKRTLDDVYLRLGQVEIDDMAAGVRALLGRPYVDGGRIGMFGTSYGGYTSLMSILRYPDLYAAASASSPVTAWYHYDTIYTERYMRTPQENTPGYEAGSAMTHVKNLKGRLMLYYGTADNNVHPSNIMQLIAALQAARKSFDVQVGPDLGHTGINTERMMEFFIEALGAPPEQRTAAGLGGTARKEFRSGDLHLRGRRRAKLRAVRQGGSPWKRRI